MIGRSSNVYILVLLLHKYSMHWIPYWYTYIIYQHAYESMDPHTSTRTYQHAYESMNPWIPILVHVRTSMHMNPWIPILVHVHTSMHRSLSKAIVL